MRASAAATVSTVLAVLLCCDYAACFTHALLQQQKKSLATPALWAKRKKAKPSNAASKQGFGAPPPTLAELVASFSTRLPADPELAKCPCGSAAGGSTYTECCGVFHQGRAFPASAKQVLQSRFSAFAYRLPGYIIETTHETCRDFQEDKIAWAKDLNKQGMFDSYDFVELMAGEEEAGSTSTTDEEEAFVDFRVRLRANAKTGKYMEGEEMVIMERSRFLKDETGWKYAGGDVRTDVAGIEDVVLNT